MNLESLIGGGGTGLLVAIGTFFGFHKRLNAHKDASASAFTNSGGKGPGNGLVLTYSLLQ